MTQLTQNKGMVRPVLGSVVLTLVVARLPVAVGSASPAAA